MDAFTLEVIVLRDKLLALKDDRDYSGDEKRVKVLDILLARICRYCGRVIPENTYCHCMNDE